MDPNATLRRLGELNNSRSFREAQAALEAASDLKEWLDNGGFAPDWAKCPGGTRLYRRLFPAPPGQPLLDARGRPIQMTPGPCLWCREEVTSQREAAGATNPHDPAWATEEGDYGCNESPETNNDGCGDHARPYDLARRLIEAPPTSGSAS